MPLAEWRSVWCRPRQEPKPAIDSSMILSYHGFRISHQSPNIRTTGSPFQRSCIRLWKQTTGLNPFREVRMHICIPLPPGLSPRPCSKYVFARIQSTASIVSNLLGWGRWSPARTTASGTLQDWSLDDPALNKNALTDRQLPEYMKCAAGVSETIYASSWIVSTSRLCSD